MADKRRRQKAEAEHDYAPLEFPYSFLGRERHAQIEREQHRKKRQHGTV